MGQGGIKRRGFMLVISSPSGAGKTTISRALLERNPNIVLSISATTRPRRPGEKEGHDYYFVSQEEFDRMVRKGEFLEHANVFDHCYGTPRRPIENALEEEKIVLFDIDWQGAQQVQEKAGQDFVSIFILPPSTEELERRLRARAQDPEEVVQARMALAPDEMSHWAEYDYVVINNVLESCLEDVEAIFRAELLKRERQTELFEMVETLRRGS